MGDQRTEAGASPLGDERDRLGHIGQSVGSVPGLHGDDTLDSKPPPSSSQPLAPEPRASPGAVARVRAWLSANQDELSIIGSLLALGIVVRVLWLREIETWGDAAQKWHFARQLLNGSEFGEGARWTHHTARFGVNIPVLLVQAVFGNPVRAYYIVPVAAHVLTTLMIYLLARRVSGRAAGVLCSLGWIFFRGLDRSSSQLLPDGMAALPLTMVAWCLIRLTEQPPRALRWVLGASLSFIWVCMIKESNLLLLPGVAAALWLTRRRVQDLAVLAACVAGTAALDTAFFALHTDYPSRMAIVQEAHGELSVRFVELFDRFRMLEPAWQMLFWLWVPSVLWLAASQDKRLRPLWILPLSFVLALTFMVRRLDPIVLWVSFKSRYFAGVAPFWVLGIGLFAVDAARRAWAAHARAGWRRIPEHFARYGVQWSLALCVLLGAGLYLTERDSLAHHPLVVERRKAIVLNDAYRRNLPIVERSDNPRALETLYAVHIRDKYIVQSSLAKDGLMPDINDAVRLARRGQPYSYLLRDPDAYTRRQLKRAIKSGCAVHVRSKGRVMVESAKLPADCKAPRGKRLPR